MIAANRGPVSFTMTGQGLVLNRGGGGLVSALSGLSESADGVPPRWIRAALSDDDRQAARAAPSGRLDRAGHDVGELAVRMLDVPAEVLDAAYNGIANSTLWFVHHMLYATPTEPRYESIVANRRPWRTLTGTSLVGGRAVCVGRGPEKPDSKPILSVPPLPLTAAGALVGAGWPAPAGA